MPAPKQPTTFDAHLGTVINSRAFIHGGRQAIADLLGLSTKTVDRKIRGEREFTVRELSLISDLLRTQPEDLVEEALKNYGDGDRQAGFTRLYNEGKDEETETSTNVGDFEEDNFDVTPEGPQEGYALAANKRRKKADTPHAE